LTTLYKQRGKIYSLRGRPPHFDERRSTLVTGSRQTLVWTGASRSTTVGSGSVILKGQRSPSGKRRRTKQKIRRKAGWEGNPELNSMLRDGGLRTRKRAAAEIALNREQESLRRRRRKRQREN